MVKLHNGVRMGVELSTVSVLSTSVSLAGIYSLCFLDILSGEVLIQCEVQFVLHLCNYFCCPFPLLYLQNSMKRRCLLFMI
jgi:hypothetical protein